MAGFKTHLTVSSLAGVGYGATAHFMYGVPASTCILAGGLCGVSGMLPDVDSGPGRPLRESMGFAAAVVPMMLIDRLEQLGLSQEMMILVGALIYVAVRFGVAELLRRYTIHRGMFHSLPAALIAGELAFLLASGDDVRLRVYKAGAVVLGYVSHLVLDELYSLELYRGRPRLKRSFGTARESVQPFVVAQPLDLRKAGAADHDRHQGAQLDAGRPTARAPTPRGTLRRRTSTTAHGRAPMPATRRLRARPTPWKKR